MKYVDSINQSLHRLLSEDENVYLIGEDLLDPYGGAFKVSKGLSTAYPSQVISTPISEAGILGFAIGMAICQCRPIVEIMFGDFITLCVDQLVNGATKFKWMYADQVNVPVVIRTPMGGRRGYGPTHSQTLECLFLNIPGISIVAPSTLHDPGQILASTVRQSENPTLFIENKMLYPQHIQQHTEELLIQEIIKTDPRYPTMHVRINIDKCSDLVLIAYGGMAEFAIEAAKSVFFSDEIVIDVLIPSLIKPLPIEDIRSILIGADNVLIIDEAPIQAGWSTCLAAHLSKNNAHHLKKINFIGAKEQPIPASMKQERETLLQTEDVIKAILNILS
ncbi:MAG TPA: transketolase C-terminal domain-containing protein [Gammaproteobacteria bacterium]|nr:transketolase C-terminal domain-containing protein [Gammaproteobacteria bacterium]